MFEDLLIHTAKVYRRSTRTDRFGQNVNVNPQSNTDAENLIGTVACRLNRSRGGMTMQERSVDVFENQWTMYTMPDVDIRTDDAITVVGPDGETLVTLAKVTRNSQAADGTHGHHLEFELWSQDGPS